MGTPKAGALPGCATPRRSTIYGVRRRESTATAFPLPVPLPVSFREPYRSSASLTMAYRR
jgi:hypothetical protein